MPVITALHKEWSHGVGRNDAKDKMSGAPVKNFSHSTKQFESAIIHTKGLSRDKDDSAREQA